MVPEQAVTGQVHWCASCQMMHGCHCRFVQCGLCYQFDCPELHANTCPGEQLRLPYPLPPLYPHYRVTPDPGTP